MLKLGERATWWALVKETTTQPVRDEGEAMPFELQERVTSLTQEN